MTKANGNISFITIKGIEDFQIVCGKAVKNNFPTHVHEKFCIGIIEEGKATLDIKAVRYCIGKGWLYLINPGEAHSIRFNEPEGFNHVVLCFGARFKSIYFNDEDILEFSEPIVYNQEMSSRILDFVYQVYEKGADAEAEFRLIELLGEVCDLYRASHESDALKKWSENINEVCSYIDSNPAANSSLEELAKAACLSRFHFCRLFKSIKGISPYDYQIQARLKRARKLLLEKKTVAETALELGFADQSHFTRFFKKNTGVTPVQFVKKNYII